MMTNEIKINFYAGKFKSLIDFTWDDFFKKSWNFKIFKNPSNFS